jgi:iron complex outermembrane receptor protein
MNHPQPRIVAVAAALALGAMAAHAQTAVTPPDAAASAADTPAPETVVVTGIRASRQKSIEAKRNADSVVDVVTAEDIGKLPDKNIADAVQRLPGVNISKASAGEGGFSENDRVSIRGTDPSLTQTLVNGHSIATADWFIQSQVGTVGRSVSYSLLPSEITDQIVVHKSAQADLVEGGVAGAVDIHTRTALSFRQRFTAEATLQAFYNDLPDKTDPQASALLGWQNEARTFGAMLQLFSENRHERRDGQEFIGYGQIQGNPGDPDAPIVAAHPDLKGVYYPELVNATLLQHQRKRHGGMLDLEARPTPDWNLDLNGYSSHMAAPSYDTSFLANPASYIVAGVSPNDGYQVRNGTLVAATFPDATPLAGAVQPGVVDKIYRPYASSQTEYVDASAKYTPNERLTLSAQAGSTRAVGQTPGDMGYEAAWAVGGLQYTMHGLGQPAAVSFPGIDTTNFNDPAVFTNGAWNSVVRPTDKEQYGQLDAQWAIDSGIWETLKAGLRFANHERNVDWPADGTCSADTNPDCAAAKPDWNGQQYPGDFGHGLNLPPGYSSNYWQLDPSAVLAFENQYNPAQPSLRNWQSQFTVKERTAAVYLMADLAGAGWRGNAGVRVVHTHEDSLFYCLSGPAPCGSEDNDGSTPTPYSSYALLPDGTHVNETFYTPNSTGQSYVDVLPSANVKLDLSKTLVARFAVARTMTRPDYSALAPAPTLDDLALTGSFGNPDLKPIRSTNFDATLEWYYAPKALLSVGLFDMQMSSFVEFATTTQTLRNNTYNKNSNYVIAFPVNTRAVNRGVELGWQQPLPGNFGFDANATFSNGHTEDGGELYGSSRFTGNAEAYYENDRFSVRLAYTYRSKYLQGLVNAVPEHDAGVGSLAMSINYKISPHFTLTFDALNMNNPVLKEYGYNEDQPQAFYVNGRQYFLGLRMAL